MKKIIIPLIITASSMAIEVTFSKTCNACYATNPDHCVTVQESTTSYVTRIDQGTFIGIAVDKDWGTTEFILPKLCISNGRAIYDSIAALSAPALKSMHDSAFAYADFNYPIPPAEYARIKKAGLAIVYARAFDHSEYTEGTGADFKFFNTSQKTIKYINITYQGINAVGDVVPSLFHGSTLRLRGVGPIYPGNTFGYSEDYAWHSDTPETIKIKSITVEYMDKTSRKIDLKKAEISQAAYDFLTSDED